MRMRRLVPTTQANYLRVVREFTVFLGRSPDTATVEDLRCYQLHLVDRGVSTISLNAAITGLKFFFATTLGREELMAKMRPIYLPRTLPVILSRDEVGRLIAAAGHLKHQTALAVAYGHPIWSIDLAYKAILFALDFCNHGCGQLQPWTKYPGLATISSVVINLLFAE